MQLDGADVPVRARRGNAQSIKVARNVGAALKLYQVRYWRVWSGDTGKVKVFFTALTISETYAWGPSTQRRYVDAIHDVNDSGGI